MTTIATFKINDAVRDVVASGVGPDPRDVAIKVLEMVPVGSERELLGLLLYEYCADYIRRKRSHRRLAVTRAAQRNNGDLGAKWSAVREAMLEESFEVSGEWKRFGDLTQTNVAWLIANRKAAAASFVTEAQRLSNLLNFMQKHKVDIVRKLPKALLEKVMS